MTAASATIASRHRSAVTRHRARPYRDRDAGGRDARAGLHRHHAGRRAFPDRCRRPEWHAAALPASYLGIAGDPGERRSRRADRSGDRACDGSRPPRPAGCMTSRAPDDMPAHVKTMLTGVSLHVPVIDGTLALGAWQGIYRGRASRAAAPARDRAAIHRQFAVIGLYCPGRSEPACRTAVRSSVSGPPETQACGKLCYAETADCETAVTGR